jgi:hypothetical protein
MSDLQKYVQEIRQALRTPGAHEFYFPRDRARRKSANLRLAREMAAVFAEHPDQAEVDNVIPSLYGKIIVAQSLDTTGVQVDNKEWVQEMRAAMQAHLERYPRSETSPVPS